MANAMIAAWRRASMHPVIRPLTEWRVYERMYPTIQELERLIRGSQPSDTFEVRDDIIRWITEPRQS